MALLKLATAYTRMFLLVDSTDHVTGKTGVTPTVTLSKAGGAFGAAGGTVTEVSSGFYKIALTTTDTNTLGDLAVHITGTGCDPTDLVDQVVAVDLADAVRLGLSALPNAAAGANGGLPTGNASGQVVVSGTATGAIAAASFAAGAIDNAAIATDAIGSAELAASAVTEIQTGLATSAALVTAQADLDDIQTRLPAALVSGRMDSSVGAMAADVLTSGAVAASAVTELQGGLSTLDAAGIRTAVGLASANLDTQIGTLATSAALTIVDDFLDTEVAAILAAVDTEVAAIKTKTDNLPAAPAAVSDIPTAIQNADALLKRDWSSVTGEAARSLLNAARFLRNKWSATAGVLTVTKEDDTTSAWTAALTSDAAAESVIGSDPT